MGTEESSCICVVLNCLQLELIIMSKRHILGWQIMSPVKACLVVPIYMDNFYCQSWYGAADLFNAASSADLKIIDYNKAHWTRWKVLFIKAFSVPVLFLLAVFFPLTNFKWRIERKAPVSLLLRIYQSVQLFFLKVISKGTFKIIFTYSGKLLSHIPHRRLL